MTSRVDIRDDADRPEGGHALVLFRNVAGPAGPGTLCIEPLTENYAYAGPREIEIDAAAYEGGLLVPVGEGALDQLEPGIAVKLSLAGTDVEAETLWPTLTPRPRTTKRRTPMARGRRREVVEAASGHVVRSSSQTSSANHIHSSHSSADAPNTQSLDQPLDAATAPPSFGSREPTYGLLGKHQGGEADVFRDDHRSPSSDPSNDAPKEDPPDNPQTTIAKGGHVRAPGWPTALVGAIAVVAFALGVAASFATRLTAEKQPKPSPTTTVALPSLYSSLAALPQVSPEGVQVEAHDWRKFLTRSRVARSSEERSFWRRWAMRAVLEERPNGAATALVDFATDVASSQPDEAKLATARLLWELAAVAGDCGAMNNIAKTLGHPETYADETLWADRARRCIGGRARP